MNAILLASWLNSLKITVHTVVNRTRSEIIFTFDTTSSRWGREGTPKSTLPLVAYINEGKTLSISPYKPLCDRQMEQIVDMAPSKSEGWDMSMILTCEYFYFTEHQILDSW